MSNGRAASALGSLTGAMAEPVKPDVAEVTTKPVQPRPKAPREKPSAAAVRSPGKHRDPEFQKTTLYIPKETRKAVTIKIASEGGGVELSALVTELLDGWTARRSDA